MEERRKTSSVDCLRKTEDEILEKKIVDKLATCGQSKFGGCAKLGNVQLNKSHFNIIK